MENDANFLIPTITLFGKCLMLSSKTEHSLIPSPRNFSSTQSIEKYLLLQTKLIKTESGTKSKIRIKPVVKNSSSLSLPLSQKKKQPKLLYSEILLLIQAFELLKNLNNSNILKTTHQKESLTI